MPQSCLAFVSGDTVTNIFESLFSKIKSIFKKLFGMEPKIAQAISATITVVAPLLETILIVLGDAPVAAIVSDIVETIQTDLAAATALVQSSGATPTLTGVLNAVVTNLNSILSAADVKDPVTLEKLTTIVNTLVAEIQAILIELPAIKNPPAPAA